MTHPRSLTSTQLSHGANHGPSDHIIRALRMVSGVLQEVLHGRYTICQKSGYFFFFLTTSVSNILQPRSRPTI